MWRQDVRKQQENSLKLLQEFVLGFPFVFGFGSGTVTASLKQSTCFLGFYIDKVADDATKIDWPLTLRHIPDSIIETAYKTFKSGNFLFSGGKDGEIRRIDYQKRIPTQVHLNEGIRIKGRR